ncbi:fibronectin type III domain-containing protein [Haliscomenobacter sp.]|uniref:fibronectin type III domain-containing protein n=1 Tax=Haliscomenobacter sp. TaxID=2717303 RepID=UPI0035935AF8
MKPPFYIFLLGCLFPILLAAQPGSACGFAPDPAAIQWMNHHHDAIARFQADPLSRNRLREVKRVPLRFVAFNAGKTAGLSQADVNLALSTLNKAFLPAGIEFFSCQAPLNVLSSPYASYLISEERALWQEFKASKVINIFCVESIEYGSVAGYTYLPGTNAPEAIFMLKTNLNQPTFAHEMGHYYGLYHTHGKSNCETLTDELVNGSNCEKTGDDVCDTPADPNLQGLGCNTSLVNSATCTYIGTVRDKNGDLFKPDVRNTMSYGPSRCRDYLSPGQYARIQYFSQFRIYPEACPAEVCTIPSITQIDSTYNSLQLQWTAFAQDSLYQLRYRTLGDTSWKTQNLTSNVWSLKNLKPCTKLELQVRRACGGAFSAWTSVLNLKTQGCGGVYCASFGGNNPSWLNRVSLGSWAYTSGDNKGYLLRENSGLSLTSNTDYNLQLEPGGILRIRDTLYWEIWVDANRDRDFEDAGERVYQGKSAYRTANKGTFSLPATLGGGSSRMRIILSLNNWAQGPCDTSIQVIETEDYDINLQSSQTCATSSRNIALSKLTSTSVTLKAQGVTSSRYQWELRDAGTSQLVIASPALSIDSFPIAVLQGNTRYQARLRIQCQNGVYSNWSDYLSFTTLDIPCPAPDASTLTVSLLGSRSAQMNCGKQPNAVYYQFHYRIKGTETWTNSTLRSINYDYISSLQPATVYEFKVKVYCNTNLSTVSADSKIAQFTTLAGCNTPDSTTLRVTQITHQSAVLQCLASSSGGFFEFSYRVRSTGTWIFLPRVSNSSTTVQGLRPETFYEFRVRIFCTTDLSLVSGYSPIKSFKTEVEPCIAPLATELTLSYLDVASYRLTNKRKGIAYYWRWRVSGTSIWADSLKTDSSSTLLRGLVFPQAYDFQARVQCAESRWSNWSPVIKIQTPDLRCSAPDSTQLLITYHGPEDITYEYKGTKLRNVQWRYKALRDTGWINLPGSAGKLPILNTDSPYEFSARGLCIATNELTPWSRSRLFVKPCPAINANDFSIQYEGEGAVLLQAKIVAAKYLWRYRIKGNFSWSTPVEGNSDLFLLKNLKADTRYEFSLSVQCGNGAATAWVTQEYKLPCTALASEISVSRITPYGVTLTYTNFNYSRVEWRYRLKGDSTWTPYNFTSYYLIGLNTLSPDRMYEAQIRKICVGESSWTNWSGSVSFKTLACSIPDSMRLVPIVISPFKVRLYAESSIYGWYVPEFDWRYRQVGATTWNSINIKGENVLNLSTLIPGAAYQVEVDLVCNESGSTQVKTLTNTFSMPEECFVLKPEEIKIVKVTHTSARVEVKLPFINPFKVRYRSKGSENYTVKSFAEYWNAMDLVQLTPGTNYEVGVQIDCGKETKWSAPVYFTTPNCQLPYAGEISLLNTATDSIQAMVEFFEYDKPLNNLQYKWRYRIKNTPGWTAAKGQNEVRVALGKLTPDQDYEVQLSVGCLGEASDSFLLHKFFRTVSDICGQKPQLSWLQIKQDSTNYSVEARCNLKAGYDLEIRFRPKPASPQAWDDAKPQKIICGNSTLYFGFYLGPVYEVQFRVLCPTGNVSAWSDVIVLENKLPGDCVTPTTENIQVRNIQSKGATVVAQNLSRKRYNWYLYSPDDFSSLNFSTINQDSLVLTNLKAGQTYQLRLGLVCTPYEVRWTEFVTFNTLPDTAANPCKGISPDDLTITQLGFQEVELSLKSIQPQENIQWRYRKADANDFWRTLSTQGLSKQIIYQLELGVNYEFQVRKLCKDLNAWSAWSESKIFAPQNCALPIPEQVFISLDFYRFPELSVAFYANTGNFKYNYHFYQRLKGSSSWQDSIKTEKNSVSFQKLIPDSTYEIQIKVFCGERFATYTRTITVPSECFQIEATSIGFEDPTHESINVFVSTVNTRLCEYRYRIKGTDAYLYADMLGFNGHTTLENLLPGTTYELSARIKCADPSRQTDWSETVEFKTKSCLIPLYGDLAVLKYYGVDSVLLQTDFGAVNYEPNLDYFWEYKSDQDSRWSKVYFRGTNFFVLKNLLKGATYQVRVNIKCPGEQGDSLLLETKLTIDSSQCTLPPDPGIVWMRADEFSNWILGVKLPEFYKYQIRRQGQSDWIGGTPVPANNAILFGNSSAPEVIWFRVICPNGNVSPWSDSIITRPTQPLVNNGAAEMLLQPSSKAGAKATLRISPNPSTGQLKVQLLQLETRTSDLIEVFNLSGQKVYSQKLEGAETSLDLSNQASGLYFVRVLAGNQSFTERILLQKP